MFGIPFFDSFYRPRGVARLRSSGIHGDDLGSTTEALLPKGSLRDRDHPGNAKFSFTASSFLLVRGVKGFLILDRRSMIRVLRGVLGTISTSLGN
jgi:hypothetical protein